MMHSNLGLSFCWTLPLTYLFVSIKITTEATTTLSPITSAAYVHPTATEQDYGDRFRIYKTFEGLAEAEVQNIFR